MITENALQVLLRRTPPEAAIRSWLEDYRGTASFDKKGPLCLYPSNYHFHSALQNEFSHYSVDEAEYVYLYAGQESILASKAKKNHGVFGLIVNSVSNMLTTDSRNECLCKYKSLLSFRELTHPIDPLIFISAFLAKHDSDISANRHVFSWPPTLRTDNTRLYHMLDHGISENHFHIGGSSNAFMFSWICLMNHFTADRRREFKEQGMDNYPLDNINVGYSGLLETSYMLTFKAACIRYFLYQRIMGRWVVYSESDKEDDGITEIRQCNDRWIADMVSVSSADECDVLAHELNSSVGALRELCTPHNDDGFVPDYAMYGEPSPPLDDDDIYLYPSVAVRNYERRLYRPLSGEQRFLYYLFRAIYLGDDNITPYLDLAYAYLLIYCRIRGELIQVNNRVGFGNFLKYQDRKEHFTEKWPKYDKMRLLIAQQSVLANPQVVTFEGRCSPSSTADELINKIKNQYRLASVSPFEEISPAGAELSRRTRENAMEKMHYVLHFIKAAQPISNNEDFEITNPRDSKVRRIVRKQSLAIIEAFDCNPDIMFKVTGIDAASNEIGCRAEVFAPDMRRIRQSRSEFIDSAHRHTVPVLRITYHAGEDFLDPIDGLRAIDEAIRFCEMSNGDRIGHALALGIDCEEWYNLKKNTVMMRKQTLLDNLTWLFGKMHQHDIQNRAAENEIQRWFKKLFTEIYTDNLTISNSNLYSVDVLDYYSSLGLRGNDPMLYEINPDDGKENRRRLSEVLRDAAATEPWKLCRKAGADYDPLSTALYHYYHFNHRMKLASDGIITYSVPRCIVDAVSELQYKMQYEISRRGICIECNPSSNFLIGTFKDYLKHPIFRFNNKFLFPSTDSRSKGRNPYIMASINTDDLGIFDTSLENEYALIACALEVRNEHCREEDMIPPDNIYAWLDNIRHNGVDQSFIKAAKHSIASKTNA